ncbi:MAG: transcription termination/antitermination protein NusG [Alphaproteobacteria bacterium]|nr:transcription termination/antitermination protein NusG [Alphaproteobacteria bacterium]
MMISTHQPHADSGTSTSEAGGPTPQTGANTTPKPGPKTWYIVQAQSGFERKIEDHLREQIKILGLEDHLCDVFVPFATVRERNGAGFKDVERNLYPGYLLVQIANKPTARINSRIVSLVRGAPKVIDFLSNNNLPIPLTDVEANEIRDRVSDDSVAMREVEVPYNTGDQVRVTDGPFASFNGFVEDIDTEKLRVKVAVTIFGRATPVDLDFNQVEKL